jgi:tRNA U34 2-thiouridine synthase MnmA/TrmU
MASGCGARGVNLLCDAAELAEWRVCFARYRSNGELVAARVRLVGEGERAVMEVEFGAPRPAVGPGQAVVVYAADDPDLVLGGGWIDRVDRCGA